MWKTGIIVVLLAAIIVPSILLAMQAQQGTETRIQAYKHTDGRIEFAVQVREGTGWSTRISPDANVLPATARTERWYSSSSIYIETTSTASHLAVEEESTQPDTTEGNLGPLYEWTYDFAPVKHLSRHRVEWTTRSMRGDKYILITSPYENGHECDGVTPCRYELLFWCSSEGEMFALLRHWWFLSNRVWSAWDSDPAIGQSQPTSPDRILTSVYHQDFADDWLAYNPPGQGKYQGEYYGVDFMLQGDAAHALMREAKAVSELTITVAHHWYHREDEMFTFDLTGAFDNPATPALSQCGEQ